MQSMSGRSEEATAPRPHTGACAGDTTHGSGPTGWLPRVRAGEPGPPGAGDGIERLQDVEWHAGDVDVGRRLDRTGDVHDADQGFSIPDRSDQGGPHALGVGEVELVTIERSTRRERHEAMTERFQRLSQPGTEVVASAVDDHPGPGVRPGVRLGLWRLSPGHLVTQSSSSFGRARRASVARDARRTRRPPISTATRPDSSVSCTSATSSPASLDGPDRAIRCAHGRSGKGRWTAMRSIATGRYTVVRSSPTSPCTSCSAASTVAGSIDGP